VPKPSLAQLIARGLLGALAFGVAYLPQLMAYQAINGYPGPSRLVARKLNFLSPHGFGVLLSPEHGLVFWTPLVVLSVIGLVWLAIRPGGADADAPSPRARTAAGGGGLSATSSAFDSESDVRRVAVCLLLMMASQVYIAGCVESWTVAGAFGQRRFVGLTSLLAVGLAALLARAFVPAATAAAAIASRSPMVSATKSSATTSPAARAAAGGATPRRGRIVCVAAVLLGVWWNLGLMAQFGAGLMDRQRLELGRNTYQTFVTIPIRLPELAYRYLFARHSFYQPAPAREP
jgi:hypothetical protein